MRNQLAISLALLIGLAHPSLAYEGSALLPNDQTELTETLDGDPVTAGVLSTLANVDDGDLVCAIEVVVAGGLDRFNFQALSLVAKFRMLIAQIIVLSPENPRRYERIEMLNRLLEIDSLLSPYRGKGLRRVRELSQGYVRTYLLWFLKDPTVENPPERFDGVNPALSNELLGNPEDPTLPFNRFRYTSLTKTLTVRDLDKLLQVPGSFRFSEMAVTAFAEIIRKGDEDSAELLHALVLGAPVTSRAAAEVFKEVFDMDRPAKSPERLMRDLDMGIDVDFAARWYIPCQMSTEEPRFIEFLRAHADLRDAVSVSLHRWSSRFAKVEKARLYLISKGALRSDNDRLDGVPVGGEWQVRKESQGQRGRRKR